MSKELRNITLLILFICLSVDNVFAQQNLTGLFTNNVSRGDEMYADLYYENAIDYYKQALKRKKDDNLLKLKIAACYRMLSDYESSVTWYDQTFQNGFEPADSIHNYYYADGLVSAGRFEEARQYYRTFWSKAPTDSRAAHKLEELDRMALLYRDSATVKIENLPFNSEFNESSAVLYNNGLLFLSSRPVQSFTDQDFLREDNPLDIFNIQYDSALGWGEAKRLNDNINSNFFEGALTINKDQDQMILSRSNIISGKAIPASDGKTNIQLYDAMKIGDEWVIGKKLPFCNPEFTYAHPALNVAGDTLYFVSNKEGGFGGNDIYMSRKVNNEWSEPANLGYIINTEGNEQYPYFIDDRLFFSSDGRGGVGGFDIFKAFLHHGIVEEVVNVGYPLNSTSDDFAYAIDKVSLRGVLSSNRSGGMGKDDIYRFRTLARILTGIVFQEQDKSLIEDAIVKLLHDGQIIGTTRTDKSGQFNFQLPLQEEFEIQVDKDEHRASVPLIIPRHLNEIDLDTLMIALHKDDLFATGRVLNNETQELMPDVRVVLHNATDNLFDTLITDQTGMYKFVLEPDKQFNIWASKSGFLFGGADINTLKIDSGRIVNDIVLELEYSKKSVVHFDFDDYKLKAEATAILRRTASAMKRTNYQLIISAYADARGTVEYNQKLSDKRAEAVSNYLISQGVAGSRIIARGFGEALILNRCVDGVDCEEVEHSKNRRAEIKIEGSNVK